MIIAVGCVLYFIFYRVSVGSICVTFQDAASAYVIESFSLCIHCRRINKNVFNNNGKRNLLQSGTYKCNLYSLVLYSVLSSKVHNH